MKTTRALSIAALGLASLLVTGCPDDGPDRRWRPAFDATDAGWLLNVWGPTPDDLLAVGGTPAEGRVYGFDGGEWTRRDIGLDVPLLNWAHGFGPDDITVVGDGGTVIHWDGSAWELQGTPTEQNLWGVWGAAPNDLWAVGGNGREDGDATILRYDGTMWMEIPVPLLDRPRVWAFFKVWGTAANRVWIVGQRGGLLHWNGSELVEQAAGTSEDLISLWGTGPDRVAAVGGRGNGVVATWDGTEWTSQSLSPLPGLNGVWMRDPDHVHVVGIEGTIAVVDFDSQSVLEDQYQETRLAFHSVFGDASGRLTAVGGNLSFPMGPWEGIAYTRELGADE
jgi:photosystem II stability/assembly factor-like uncharacterized protein